MAPSPKTQVQASPRFKNGSEATCLPVCHHPRLVWEVFRKPRRRLGPDKVLAFLTESGLLRSLKVRMAIISFENQTEVWVPESRDHGCSVICKFTQGAKADGKRLRRRLLTDRGELDYLVRDTRQSVTLVGAPERCPLGHILTYYDVSQPQYAHLRASIPTSTSSQCYRGSNQKRRSVWPLTASMSEKSALHKAFVAPKRCDCGEVGCVLCLLEEDYDAPVEVATGQWRDKGEHHYMAMEHAVYLAKPECKATKKDLTPSTVPCHDDPLSKHCLRYVNGGGGSSKTTPAIELFRTRNPLVFTPTHRLAKEMRARGVQAQTFNSFFQTGRPNGWNRSLFPV